MEENYWEVQNHNVDFHRRNANYATTFQHEDLVYNFHTFQVVDSCTNPLDVHKEPITTYVDDRENIVIYHNLIIKDQIYDDRNLLTLF